MQCPVCESNGGFAEIESLQYFKIWRCRNCGLGFSDPMTCTPEVYERLYSDSRETKSRKYTGFAVQLERWNNGIPKGKGRHVLKYYERIALEIMEKRLCKDDHILDMGCGSGRFLAALRDSGFQPLGIDIAPEPVKVLKRLGFEVAQGTVEDFPKDWPAPKAIALFEVLEHLPDPVNSLKSLADRHPHSLLILSVPSPKRWYLWRGKREPEDYPPNHLTRWSEKAIKIALKRAGYKKIKVKFMPVRPTEITGSGLGKFAFFLTRRSTDKITSKEQEPDAVLKKRKYWFHPVDTERILAAFKKIFFMPLALYLRARGFTGISMLVIAETNQSLDT